MKPASSNQSAPAMAAPLRLSFTHAISQGARDYQEDACGHWVTAAGARLFAVVADGAGGHGGGAEAAQAAVASAAARWRQDPAPADPAAFLKTWMLEAHGAVNEAAAKIRRSARAVVVACVADGTTAHWVHAGDSRLLRFRAGKLVERTRDDSVVQVLFERGEITEEEMGTHPDQSRLLQSLGGEEPPSPRPGAADLAPGDALILCSDGFWEHLKQSDLEALVAIPPQQRQSALNAAVAVAVQRAGPKADNTTAVMIHCDPAGGASQSRSGLLLLLLSAALAGAAAAWWLMDQPLWPRLPARASHVPATPPSPPDAPAGLPQDIPPNTPQDAPEDIEPDIPPGTPPDGTELDSQPAGDGAPASEPPMPPAPPVGAPNDPLPEPTAPPEQQQPSPTEP